MFKLNAVYGCISALCSVLVISNSYATDIVTVNGITIKSDIKHDTSLPLTYMHAKGNALSCNHPFSTFKQKLAEINATQIDQSKSLLVPLKGFQGLGAGLGCYHINVKQPDPASSVGLMQFVQAVNSALAVFDKATGQLATGFPKPLNELWTGFGGACETQNLGGASVKYDQLARRWVISKHAYDDVNTGPFYQCFAVSTSEDATGSYHRYVFQFDSLNENTHVGLWPNAYLLGTYQKDPNATGPLMCALDRSRMISGLPASMQCKMGLPQGGPVQPIDLDGRSLPISNAGFFASPNSPNNILFYRFNVDFTNPANTTLTNFNIAVSPFQEACPLTHGLACAIQPYTPNRLDVYSDRVMSRFIYRQFDGHGAMLLTHNIEGLAPKRAPAIRWYEMRVPINNPNANPVIYQQATIAPDSKNRFTGSIAIDRFANIAIGYTVTSSLIFPSIEMAMHHFPDPLNIMKIQPLATGRGSQIHDVHEWGSQSSMSVDPIDECTFWHTGEYLQTTGSYNWSTYILRFKLTACT